MVFIPKYTPVFVPRTLCGQIPASKNASYVVSRTIREIGSIEWERYESIAKKDESNFSADLIFPVRDPKPSL